VERQYRSPTKGHRGSTGHHTRTGSRHTTKTKERRDSSPGSSSSSRSRSGSRDRKRGHGADGSGHGKQPTDNPDKLVSEGTGRKSENGMGNGRGPPDNSVKREPAETPGSRRDDTGQPVTPAVAAARVAFAKFVGNNLKYDGTTCLETYLDCFNKYTHYLNWDERPVL